MTRKTSATSHKRTLDTEFRQFIRERDKVCQLSSALCWGSLECAHFHPRRHLTVRWDPNNAALLCQRHHRHLDTHEDEKWEWIAQRLGPDKLRDLRERRNEAWPGASFYPEMRRQLRAILNGSVA